MECKRAVQNKSGDLFTLDAISDREFARFQQLIYDLAGITLGEHKKNLVAVRLADRLRHFSLTSFADYYRLLMNDPPLRESCKSWLIT